MNIKKSLCLLFLLMGQTIFGQRYYHSDGYYRERRRNRKVEGLFGGAAGGALLGGLIGGGRGAGYGALAGGLIGLAAGSEADKRARYYEEFKPAIYTHGNVNGYMVYYFNDENNQPIYFYYDDYGRRTYIELR